MVWLIILFEILISFPLAILLSKTCFGNMDKEYYDEIELINDETTQEEIDQILLFGTVEEGNDYEEEI